MAESNPFQLVNSALWELLESHSAFDGATKVGNRLKFDKVDPVKRQVSNADLPEVRLVPTNMTPHLHRTSNSSSCKVRWEVQVATGDNRVEDPLLKFAWIIYTAMSRWTERLTQLEWRNRKICKDLRLPAVTIGVAEQDLRRGIEGWSTVWACEVELWFRTIDLQEE